MKDEKIKKFEGKERLQELSPRDTLKRAGFKDGMSLCDIGAGTGIFVFPAREMSSKDSYALEKSDDMIEILNTRIAERQIENLKVKKVESDLLPMKDDRCDLVSLITVLHHIDDKKALVEEIRRISKEGGRLLIIEFHKNQISGGPPIEMKISKEELEDFASEYKLKTIDKFDLGQNFYGHVFEL